MPIRINLKELFGSDPQSVTVDKINFNFNKLLELGIGLPGAKGLTGPQGPAGPQGITGQQGTRGTLWFIGNGDPNFQTLTGLLNGDFYLNTTNSEIWQYNIENDNWTRLIDFETIVNDFLLTSGVAFIRGLGETSPDDDRFIVFPFRGNDTTAQVADILEGSSQNDILFLNNFNEKFNVVDIDNFPISTNQLYTAIQKIYVDSTTGIPGRYHLELGSLFADSNGPNTNLLSSLKHNLKVRHIVDDLGGNSEYPASNSYLYLSKFSLSKSELQSPGELDYNSAFEFITSKYNNEGVNPIQRELTIRLGSTEALGEYVSGSLANGISISLSNSEGSMELGVAKNLSSNNTDINNNNYALINHDASLSGVMILKPTYQDGGNIEQLGSAGSGGIDLAATAVGINPSTGARNVFHNLGIASHGNRLYTVDGVSPEGTEALDLGPPLTINWVPTPLDNTNLKGTIYHWNIQDGTPRLNTQTTANDGLSYSISDSWITGAGLCDIEVDGKYGYIVHNQVRIHTAEDGNTYRQTNLQVVDLNNQGQRPVRVNPKVAAYDTNQNSFDDLLDGAWRIKLMGDIAVIGTNKCRTWGASNPSMTGLETIFEDSKIVLVDITDPTQPSLAVSQNSVTPDSHIEISKGHVLDMDVYENYVITVQLEFLGVAYPTSGPDPSATAQNGHRVTLNIYEVTKFAGGRSISKKASRTIYQSSTEITKFNFEDQIVLNKTASVSTDGKDIYVSYIDNLHICKLDGFDWQSAPNVSIPLVEILTYTTRSGGVKSYDSKVAGNSLYLLNGGPGTQFTSTDTYLTKINISDKLTPYVEWEESVTNGGTRLEVVGNRAYIASQTFPGTGSTLRHGIVTFKLDEIKSDHANISNLRADKAKIMMDLEVGNSAKVYGSLNVGGGAKFDGSVSVFGEFQSVGQPRVKQLSLTPNANTVNLDASTAGLFRVERSFNGVGTIRILNLKEGSSALVWIRNTNVSNQNVFIQAGPGPQATAVSVNLSNRGLASTTSVNLAATSGTATVWVANVGGQIIGAVY